MKSILHLICFFLSISLCLAQQLTPNENLKGSWGSGKNGILIDDDKLTVLEKNEVWSPLKSGEATYKFIGKPLLNTESVYQIWVTNTVEKKVIVDKEKEGTKTKQYRIIKIELLKNGKLKLKLFNVVSESAYKPGDYLVSMPKSSVRTEFTFKRLSQD